MVTYEDAHEACANSIVQDDDHEDCVFDVLATNDLEMAEAYQ